MLRWRAAPFPTGGNVSLAAKDEAGAVNTKNIRTMGSEDEAEDFFPEGKSTLIARGMRLRGSEAGSSGEI